MKKKLFLLAASCAFLLPCKAEKVKVEIKSQQSKDVLKPVKRAPMNLPIEVIYDTEARIVEITSYSDLEGEVYLYDASGALEDYSPCLNTVLSVSDSQYHTILIEGDGWEATGVIE